VQNRPAYTVLTFAAVGLAVAQVFSTTEKTIQANDRSRWATVRALVHDRSYAIGQRVFLPDGGYRDEGIVAERGWDTIDKVMDPATGTFYSSKPPLFPTLVAGVYWVVSALTGLTIVDDQLPVVRIVLLIVNVLPLAAYLLVLGRLIDRLGGTDWGRLFVFTAACFGTFVTTFATVLNNHTPAACLMAGALYYALGAVRLDLFGAAERAPRWACARAGFLAGSAAAFELPAAAALAWIAAWVGRRRGATAGAIVLTAAAVPLAAWVVTNYLAIGQLRPAYSHQGGTWYQYDGSPWRPGRLEGIDTAGESETKFEYAFHLTVGHHGLFSLTPVFVLALGACRTPGRPDRRPTPQAERAGSQDEVLTHIGWAAVLLTSITLAFYVLRSSNYGGWTVGPRWFFWLTPLLLSAALPAADALAQTSRGRLLGGFLLVASVFSAGYRATRPWSHTWLYDLIVFFDPRFAY